MEKGIKQDPSSPLKDDVRKRRPSRKARTMLADDGELIVTPMQKKKGNGKRRKDERKPKLEEEPIDIDSNKDKQQADIPCYVAQSSLILPFNVKISAVGEPINMIITEKLLSREIKYWSSSSDHLSSSNLWRLYSWDDVPPEVGDLNILFRQHVVWSPREKFQDEKTWTCRRFVMNDEVRTNLFDTVQVHTIQNGQPVSYQGRFNNIEVLLFPMGCLIVVIHVDWIPGASGDASETINLSDVRTLIYVSKYRDKVESVCDGWSFKAPEDGDDVLKRREQGSACSQVEASLGRSVYSAKYLGKPISLRTFCFWLLNFAEEAQFGFEASGDAPLSESSLERTNSCSSLTMPDPVQRSSAVERPIDLRLTHRKPTEKIVLTTLEHTRHAIHHSTVVTENEIPGEMLHDYLFHLKRAFGQKNRPPPAVAIGKVMIWRKNRYIGTSREGTVSLSWPTSPSREDFEVQNWHKKFQGIYLTLFLYVLGERMVFLELSDLASSQAEKLRFREDTNLTEMKHCRDVMRNLATRMVRYTLSMCSDVGGISEYSEFFSVIRQMFSVPDLRNELSNELKDVLAAVESNYLEEERVQRENEEKENRIQNGRKPNKLERTIKTNNLPSFLPFLEPLPFRSS